MNSIPSSKLSRISVYGTTATKVGFNTLSHKAKKLINTKLSDEKLLEKNSKIIFEALTKLRGTALKMAQLLSLENGLLSPKYIKELEKSTYRVRPLNRAVVRKTIKSELGEYPENIFETFDTQAFAAASLGQVHKATDKEGNKLAVKMQYPGIDNTLKQDLEIIRLSLKVMTHSKVVIETLDEVEETLEEEVSYLTEAKNLKYFQEKMARKPVIIPKVFPNYSNDKILTMEYLE
jgi:predicted unusual protein kinase regulating ubiquinone biosynthesis (AarF/ABC1/UbiB family)